MAAHPDQFYCRKCAFDHAQEGEEHLELVELLYFLVGRGKMKMLVLLRFGNWQEYFLTKPTSF